MKDRTISVTLDFTHEQWVIILLMLRQEYPSLPKSLWLSAEIIQENLEQALDDVYVCRSCQDSIKANLNSIIHKNEEVSDDNSN